jgi:hypothetical protein
MAFAKDFSYRGLTYTVLTESTCETKEGKWSSSEAGNDVSGDIVIPEIVYDGNTSYTVTKIGNKSFSYCKGITSVLLPSTISVIGESAFQGCSGLSSISIPSSIQYIYDWAFYSCYSLKQVEISDLEAWCKISIGSYGANPLSNGAALFLNDNLISELVVPSSVTSIKTNAFNGCKSLTAVVIPPSVVNIGYNAFENCSNLASVEIPNTVTSIGGFAFSGTGITSIQIPNSITKIGYETFSYCKKLASLVIPNSVTTIDVSAFENCINLKSVLIPESVVNIGSNVFSGCPLEFICSLATTPPTITSTSFPSNTNTILFVQNEAYKTSSIWKGFRNINVLNAGSDAGIRTFEHDGLMYEITSLDDYTCRVYGRNDSSNLDIIIPEKVEYRGRMLNVTEIKSCFLYDCKDINSLIISDKLKIAEAAILNSDIKSIEIISDSLSQLSAEYMSLFCNIGELVIESNSIPKLLIGSTIGELIIRPTAKTISEMSGNFIKRITIENDTTALIGTATGIACSVESVYIGRDISSNMFSDIVSLKNVVFGQYVTSVGANAFSGCSALNRVGAVDIGSWSQINFENKEANPISYTHSLYLNDDEVLELEVSDSITVIGSYAFSGLSNLVSIKFGKNLELVKSGAFDNCPSIKVVYSYNTTPPTMESGFDNDVYFDAVLCVPPMSLSAYESANVWKKFWEIKPISGYVGINDSKIENDVIVLTQNGEIVLRNVGENTCYIMTIDGSLVYKGYGDFRLKVEKGIYIVSIGKKVLKVVV